MKLVLVLKTARCAVIMAEDGSVFEADTPYQVYLNGNLVLESRRTVLSLYGLEPVSYTHLLCVLRFSEDT